MAVLTSVSARAASASPITILDDFEDGTTENWFAGGGPLGAVPPFPPSNIANGGPLGAGDNYLQIVSSGGAGAGSRLVAMNASQWALDYLAGGVLQIEMDVINLGTTDLALRLLFEDPIAGPPSNMAISKDPIAVPSGSGWIHIVFPITPADLVALLGSVTDALSNTTLLRVFHNPDATFPGPVLAATLGVDNITARVNVVVPEPAALLLVLSGVALVARRHRTRRL